MSSEVHVIKGTLLIRLGLVPQERTHFVFFPVFLQDNLCIIVDLFKASFKTLTLCETRPMSALKSYSKNVSESRWKNSNTSLGQAQLKYMKLTHTPGVVRSPL